MARYEVTVRIVVEADDADQAFMQVGTDIDYLCEVSNDDDDHIISVDIATDVDRVFP